MDSRSLEPPGTVQIEEWSTIVLQPPPSDDPDDPLNWSKSRKTVNFTLVLLFTLFTFSLVDIGTVAWGPMNEELGISFENMNNSFAANLAGLGVCCIFAVPLAQKYGRRPVYLVSLLVQIAGSIWQAKVMSAWELIVSNVVTGIAGAVSEVMVQMTVNDLFFVHQRGRANGIYLVMVSMGAYVALVPAGFITISQGWRWIWWWCVILICSTFVLFAFFYEESKYAVAFVGQGMPKESAENTNKSKSPLPEDVYQTVRQKKSYKQRLALATTTDTPILQHIVQPFHLLFTFPAVSYTSIIYGSLLCWFSVLATTQSTYLLESPYNFSAAGVGLFNLATFIGTVLGSIVGGPISDWWIGLPWIVVAVGAAVFGFAFTLLADVSLSYLMDCYQDMVGDAFVAVTFIRNGLSMIFVFCLSPWIAATGLENMFIAVACIALAINSITIPMIIWGKKARRATAARYRILAQSRRHQFR
ncbi:major facilitator superfamily domain-containing protein [Aspergillus ambiguus]|uniref:major facilitator superfamily domain-containing protein n=1 Tax=Aspergillus ambiguus TaxID=176160 RepID=UPI003CCE4E6C